MAEVTHSPHSAVFHVDHKRRKITPERAKANYLCGQLRLRLQYARLKVEHGWQRQTLNEVENLYFRHTHKNRLPNTPNSGGRRVTASNSTYMPNMLFPVNEDRHGYDIAPEDQVAHNLGGEPSLNPTVETGAGSGGADDVCVSPHVAPSSASVETPHAVLSVRSGSDSGTLEQAAASMFSLPPPVATPHTVFAQSPSITAPPLVSGPLDLLPNGVMQTHYQPTGVPFGGSGASFSPTGQEPFCPTQPFQFEFHHHTQPQPPPQPPQQPQESLQLQPRSPSQPQSSPQSHHEQLGSFRAMAPALLPGQQHAPSNPTLTYDAFWSSHSLSSYRHVLSNSPGLGPQSQSSNVPVRNGLGAAGAFSHAGPVPVSAPASAAGLAEAAAAYATSMPNS